MKSFQMAGMSLRGLALLSAVGFAGLASADSISIDFENYTLGPVAGGPSLQAPGNNAWWLPDNAATAARFEAGIGRGGSRGLVVGNRGNGNDGVIDNCKTPELVDMAGESSTGAPYRSFTSSYWFRSASSTYSPSFRMASEIWGPDRTTFIRFVPDGVSGIRAEAAGMLPGQIFPLSTISGLQFGQWYRVEKTLHFVDGPTAPMAPANDFVITSIYDASGTLMGTVRTTSWEPGARNHGYNGGNIFGVRKLQFHSRLAGVGDQVYIDDISYSTTPLGGAPVDLSGTYSAPGASTATNALASATTANQADQVAVSASGAAALENSFTPFSDASKKPAIFAGVDMRGKTFSANIDLGDLSRWTVGREVFHLGLGAQATYMDATPESFVAVRRAAGGPEIFFATDRSALVTQSFAAPAGATQFTVAVTYDAFGTTARLEVTPLNGPTAGMTTTVGTYNLDGANDAVASASFFAGFTSGSIGAGAAQMRVTNFRTTGGSNAMFAFAHDAYQLPTELGVYEFGQANLTGPIGGFQAFLGSTGTIANVGRTYTTNPFSQNFATPNWFELNGGIGTDGVLTSVDAVLALLNFSGVHGATGAISINPFNGASTLPTIFSDADGTDINPLLRSSNVLVFDSEPPVPAVLSATQGSLSVLSNPVMTGLVSLSLTSSDALSGLDRHPSVTIDFAPIGAGPEDVTLNTASSTGNTFTASYNVPVSAPNGPGQIIVSSVDRAGNTQSQSFAINVNTATVTLNLSLIGVTANVTRGVEIRLGKSGGLGSPLVLSRNVNFTGGAATLVFNALDGIPSDASVANYQISAKDTLHTLRSRAAVTGSGNTYSGTLALRGGNLNGDGRIDIGDYVVYATRFGITVSPNTPFAGMATSHASTLRHTDITGDGAVDAADFSFIATQFGLQFDDAEVGGMARPDRTVRLRITVKDAVRESGSKAAASFDLDGDGWITMEEMQRVLRGLR